MRVHFTSDGWQDFRHWQRADAAIFEKINVFLDDIMRHPFTGLGKPEPLRAEFAGWWSRRITDEHRLIYRVEGRAGIDQRVEVYSCRNHYRRR